MVIDRVTGFRYPKGDADALSHLLDEFLASRLDVDRVTAAAREEILGRRNLQNYVDAFDEALRRALAR